MSRDIDIGKECIGSPETVLEGEQVTFSLTYPAQITIDSGSFMEAHRGSNDESSNVLSGSLSGDGTTVLTLKTISNEVGRTGGAEYVYTFGVTCQGIRKVYYFRRFVLKRSLQ